MNLIIGEIIADFSECKIDGNSFYQESFSGSIIDFAETLKEGGKDFEIVTKLGSDKLAKTEENAIYELYRKDMKYSISSPYLSPVAIDGDLRLKSTAVATISTEELEFTIQPLKPTSILLSGALLSLNPSGSAIVDCLCFLDQRPKVFIDLMAEASFYYSMEILKKNVDTLSATLDTYLLGDVVSSEKAKRIEKSHLCDYLE